MACFMSVIGESSVIPSSPRRDVFIHFFVNRSELFRFRSQRWLGGQGVPGWRVSRFKESVTPGEQANVRAIRQCTAVIMV